MASKTIVCADALDFLAENRVGAIVTSPPDADEIEASPEDWEAWFAGALGACFRASLGPVVVYVTDRKGGGRLFSKAAMVHAAAAAAGVAPAWHKIALRRDVEATDLFRPTFSHLIAFGGPPGVATPDVFRRGAVLYPNGTGIVATRVAIEWAGGLSSDRVVLDPFCGRGTIPAVAEALGFDAIGVDLDPDQCDRARALKLRRFK
jgi:hypothetical protein